MRTSYPYPFGPSTLADAKARLNIHDLWQHFGLDGEPKAGCRCPFHEDRKNSFSVFIGEDGFDAWNCFTGCGGGDAVDFFQRASGLSPKEACRKFMRLAGGRFTPKHRAARPLPKPAEPKPRPNFPDFHKGTPADFVQLARLRHIGREGLEFASERGLLWFATLKNCPAWIVTDSERVNAQARRMDGQEWEHISAKAWTAKGSWAVWPIGIKEAHPFPAIALVEGGPDFLAAHYLALWEQATHHGKRDVQCVPVTMLGASLMIHPDALPLFTGKRVRIFGHADEAGRAAVEVWARQLASVGADVDAFDFSSLLQCDQLEPGRHNQRQEDACPFAGLVPTDGKPVDDLNDALLMDAASFTQAERILP